MKGSITKDYSAYKLTTNCLLYTSTLLSAMERAGNEELTEDTEKKGLGTPATRAAVSYTHLDVYKRQI